MLRVFSRAAHGSSQECWICFDCATFFRPLKSMCKCPVVCHARCLDMWREVKKGTSEETHCRMCRAQYPPRRQVQKKHRVCVFLNGTYIGKVSYRKNREGEPARYRQKLCSHVSLFVADGLHTPQGRERLQRMFERLLFVCDNGYHFTGIGSFARALDHTITEVHLNC